MSLIQREIPCGKNFNLRLEGLSRSFDGTCMFVPQLGAQLDCGRKIDWSLKRTMLFITHGHLDHVSDLPMITHPSRQRYQSSSKINIYCPAEIAGILLDYSNAAYNLNLSSRVSALELHEQSIYTLTGVTPGDHIPLAKDWRVEVLMCDHGVPCLAYAFFETRKCLNEKYIGSTPDEICDLRKLGVDIHSERLVRRFIYCGDTSIKFFGLHSAKLQSYPVIIVECTYLDGPVERATRRRHIHWSQLSPWVTSMSQTIFVLIHFSKRYTEDFIREFFIEQDYSNVIPWV